MLSHNTTDSATAAYLVYARYVEICSHDIECSFCIAEKVLLVRKNKTLKESQV